MAAAKLNLEVEQGVTFRHILNLQSAGVPFNLTSYVARLQMRKNVDHPVVLLSLTEASGLTITPLTGVITIVMTATQTSLLASSSAVYDLEIESTGGEVTRLLQGVVRISKQVTR